MQTGKFVSENVEDQTEQVKWLANLQFVQWGYIYICLYKNNRCKIIDILQQILTLLGGGGVPDFLVVYYFSIPPVLLNWWSWENCMWWCSL